MKKFITFSLYTSVFFIFVFISLLWSRENTSHKGSNFTKGMLPGTPNATLWNINNISGWLRNDGWSGRNPYTGKIMLIMQQEVKR